MEKIYTGRMLNIPAIAQEINQLLLSEGWECMIQNPMMPQMPAGSQQYFDTTIRAIKRGHLHHTETVIVRVMGYPNEVRVIVEEEHIGPIGREFINRRLFSTLEKEIRDGLFDLPMGYQTPPTAYGTPATQPYQPPMQAGQQGRCPQCGTPVQPGAKFCFNCGYKLM